MAVHINELRQQQAELLQTLATQNGESIDLSALVHQLSLLAVTDHGDVIGAVACLREAEHQLAVTLLMAADTSSDSDGNSETDPVVNRDQVQAQLIGKAMKKLRSAGMNTARIHAPTDNVQPMPDSGSTGRLETDRSLLANHLWTNLQQTHVSPNDAEPDIPQGEPAIHDSPQTGTATPDQASDTTDPTDRLADENPGEQAAIEPNEPACSAHAA